MLGRIKFLASVMKCISPYCSLAGLKLNTPSLVCDCKIPSILVAFFILRFYIVWIFLLPFYQVLDCFSTRRMYISFFSYVFRYDKAKQLSQMNTCHLSYKGQSLKWKNICEEAKVLVKREAAFFISFKPGYRYFPWLVKFIDLLSETRSPIPQK